MISLDIKYSLEIDEKRIKNTLGQLEWFDEKGYKNILLPLGISKDSSQNEIKKAVERDFAENQKNYLAEKDFLAERWPSCEKILEEKLRSCEIKPYENYVVQLTSYGVGGSYNLPNLILVNIKRSWQIGLLRTVIHEIIHLSIENYIKAYNTGHWIKERVVDLLLNEFFPNLSKMQNLPIPMEEIDKHFFALYPNVKTIIQKVSK